MGVSCDTFYRYRSARDDGGVEPLLEQPRRKPNPKLGGAPDRAGSVGMLLGISGAWTSPCQQRAEENRRIRLTQRGTQHLAATRAAKP